MYKIEDCSFKQYDINLFYTFLPYGFLRWVIRYIYLKNSDSDWKKIEIKIQSGHAANIRNLTMRVMNMPKFQVFQVVTTLKVMYKFGPILPWAFSRK